MTSPTPPYRLAIAGTTQHTVMCAEALRQDSRFTIPWVLTPSPRPIGRKQTITKNPLHLWAEEHNLPIFLVEKKIDQRAKEEILKPSNAAGRQVQDDGNLDFLLVVDFGYLIPEWLLQLPTIAPVNIHPSALPKYRGSSPGQFAVLFGEKESAVSVITMTKDLDAGDIIDQSFFEITDKESVQEYYQKSFTLIAEKLPKILIDFAHGETIAHPQPIQSPTPIARRLTKEDGFVDWQLLTSLLHNREPMVGQTAELLIQANQTHQDWQRTVGHALRALSRWPGVWTIVPTNKGDKRMKLLSLAEGKTFQLDQVQLEGLQPTTFNAIKNQLV